MNEYEKLKWICDKIEYKIDVDIRCDCDWFYRLYNWEEAPVDVREIIFTTEFMDRYTGMHPALNMCNLLMNLDDPIQYLYNLLTQTCINK